MFMDIINNLNSNSYCLNPTVAYEINYYHQPSTKIIFLLLLSTMMEYIVYIVGSAYPAI